MLTPFATLAFLATLWLMTVLASEMFGRSRAKVVAALSGRSMLSVANSIRPVAMRVKQRHRPQSILRAQPELRVAA